MTKKETFWNAASRCGLVLGGVEILFLLLGIWSKNNFFVSLCHIVLFVALLCLFTRRRADRFGAAEGYSYGDGLRFILALSLFAGIMYGAFEIFARNYFFPDLYHEQLKQSMAVVAKAKIYSTAQLAEMKQYTEKVLFSPVWIVVTDIMAMTLQGLFFGLFIAAFTRREADPFHEPERVDENADAQ